MNLFYYIIIIFLFDKIILDNIYDFSKNGSFKSSRKYCVFDSSQFINGEEIYFEIKSTKFNNNDLGYIFLDVIPDDYDFDSKTGILYESPEKQSTVKNNKNKITKYINYYIITKSNDELGELEGKYLILYFNCKNAEIKNIDKNLIKEDKNEDEEEKEKNVEDTDSTCGNLSEAEEEDELHSVGIFIRKGVKYFLEEVNIIKK